MARVLFPKTRQAEWLNKIFAGNVKARDIANICNLSERTIRDWRKEKFSISEEALLKISQIYNLPIPPDIKIIPDFWYALKGARKGALRRMELYGPPGTPEGRRKGGQISQLKRKLYPERYPNCILPKRYHFPKKSVKLAEFIGIILGDGGITDRQVKISLNKETEPDYIDFVSSLIKDLLNEYPQKYYFRGKSKKVCVLCLGGVNLVEFLKEMGLEKGNKIIRQVNVPEWIAHDREYRKACLRGLVDTDGCIYFHHHITNGFKCLNCGLTLTNHSRPLIKFAEQTLLQEDFSPKTKEKAVYLYRQCEVERYFDIIGSHNQHHFRRLKDIHKARETRRSTQEA